MELRCARVRFATIQLPAAIVEQIVERTLGSNQGAHGDIVSAKRQARRSRRRAALVLGVLAARVWTAHPAPWGSADDLTRAAGSSDRAVSVTGARHAPAYGKGSQGDAGCGWTGFTPPASAAVSALTKSSS